MEMNMANNARIISPNTYIPFSKCYLINQSAFKRNNMGIFMNIEAFHINIIIIIITITSPVETYTEISQLPANVLDAQSVPFLW